MTRFMFLLPWRSMRARIAIVLVGLTLALGVVALIQATLDLTNILEGQLQNRGTAIARELAAQSALPSQTNDVFALYQVFNDSLISNKDVRYIFLVEPSKEIRVHTFEKGMPAALVDVNDWNPGEPQSVRHLRTNEGPILDIAIPVMGGKGGIIRLGMSKAGIKTQVRDYIVRLAVLLGVAILAAIALSFVIASLLTRSLRRVAEASRKVGRGDLSVTVPVEAGSEVGGLATAFNSMTVELRRSREALVQRNVELETLNSMADTLSRQLGRERVTHAALDKLIELTQLSAAWVCVKSSNGTMELVTHRGLAMPELSTLQSDRRGRCHCRTAFGGQPGQGPQSILSCPLVVADKLGANSIRPYAIVPLQSRGDVIGTLGMVSAEAGDFDEARIQLFTSIGQQIGVALENATLYEELEKKERARAELLQKLIGAQEEERKRIAREIHDEPAQALSGAIFQLNALERQVTEQGVAGAAEIPIDSVRQGVRTAMESLHRITTELRPQALDDLGFVPAIRWYAQQRLGDRGVNVDLSATGQPDKLPSTIEVAAFRITQEAINNVARHAEATNARIHLVFGEEAVSGEVKDDGKGFYPDTVMGRSKDGAGLGLLGMRERAGLLGGDLQVSSAPGEGTCVWFEIPLSDRSVRHG